MNIDPQLRRSARTPKPASFGTNYVSGNAASVAQAKKEASRQHAIHQQMAKQKENQKFANMMSAFNPFRGGIRRRTNKKRKTSKRALRKRKTMRRK